MSKNNFTLIEMSVVLLVIVTLASVFINMAIPVVNNTTEWNLSQKMIQIEEAIIGNRAIRDVDGSIIPNGFINDVGRFPDPDNPLLEYSYQQLEENISATLPDYTSHSLAPVSNGSLSGGWRGPYFIRGSESNKINEIIKLEKIDLDSDGQDDLRIYAQGYSDLDRIIYWKNHFQKRAITILGIPPEFTARITVQYISDGVLQESTDDIKGSGETSIPLPKGICAFSAELIVKHTVLEKVTDESTLSSGSKIAGFYLLTASDKVVFWDGSSTEGEMLEDGETLHNQSLDKYYLYENDSLQEKTVNGTKTANIVKTMKTDIQMRLE